MNQILKLATIVIALPLGGLAGSVGLGGCTAQRYQVKVNNQTDHPVTAAVWERAEGEDQRRISRFIGPLDSHTLSATPGQSRHNVWLTVDFAGNQGRPEELPLSPGLTVVNVLRRDEGTRGRIQLQEVD